MPIRFRCAYCNQLMGISHRKAGSVVRCPKCAGEIIVPVPEGAAPPEEGPEQAVPPEELKFEPRVNLPVNVAVNAAAPTENAPPPADVQVRAPAPALAPRRRGLFLPLGMLIVSLIVVILLLILVFVLGLIIGRHTMMDGPKAPSDFSPVNGAECVRQKI